MRDLKKKTRKRSSKAVKIKKRRVGLDFRTFSVMIGKRIITIDAHIQFIAVEKGITFG